MPDARSPIRHHLVLYRRDPEQGRARFFSLMIERDLFGTIRLVRNWRQSAPRAKRRSKSFPRKPRRPAPWRRGPKLRDARDTRTFDEAARTVASIVQALGLMSDTPSKFDQGQHLSCSDQD
jgi:predicted DNA-binding WGR domain protein